MSNLSFEIKKHTIKTLYFPPKTDMTRSFLYSSCTHNYTTPEDFWELKGRAEKPH